MIVNSSDHYRTVRFPSTQRLLVLFIQEMVLGHFTQHGALTTILVLNINFLGAQ